MGWLSENLPSSTTIVQEVSGQFKGAYNSVKDLLSFGLNPENSEYTNEADTEDTKTTEQGYTTKVIYGTPLRKTKYLFVPEIADGIELYDGSEDIYSFSEEELNTVYHSKEEYSKAIETYGLIYKTQKFDNADTTTKLLQYACDWIKNNYHGGITNFTITAMDMHLAGMNDRQKLTVGRRVDVKYTNPATQQPTSQTLTIISVEYDLNNPEKNQYKIGIPDVTLEKVYGESSKSGSGGGSSGKTSDETDEETNTEVDLLADAQKELDGILDEKTWAHMITGLTTNDDGVEGQFTLSSLLTPKEKDPTSKNTFAMTADALKSTIVEGTRATFNKFFGNYINAKEGVDTDTLSSNQSNTGRTNASSVDVVETATAKKLVAREDAEITKTTTTKDLKATNNVTVSNKTKTTDLEVTNNATVAYKTKTKTLEVTDSVVGDLTVAQKLSASNVEATNKVKGKDGEFSNNLSVTKTVSAKDVSASNDITATNNVEATNKVKGKDGEFSNNLSVTKTTTTKDLSVTNDASVSGALDVTGDISGSNITASGKITGDDGEFSTMKIDGKTVKFGVSNSKPVIWINGTRYDLEVQSSGDDE